MLTPEQVQQYRSQYGLGQNAPMPTAQTNVPSTPNKWASPSVLNSNQTIGKSSFPSSPAPKQLPSWYTQLRQSQQQSSQPQQQQNKPGFFSRAVKGLEHYGQSVGNDVKNAFNDSVQAIENAPKSANNWKDSFGQFSAGMHVAGNAMGALLSPVSEAISPIVNKAADAVANDSSGQFQKFANSGIGDKIAGAQQAMSDWAAKHPQAAKDLQDINNAVQLGSVIGGSDAIKGGISQVADTAGEALKTAKGAVSDMASNLVEKNAIRGANKALNDTLEVVSPKMTATEEAAAKAAGRGVTKGKVFKTVSIAPTDAEMEMAQVAKEAGVKSTNAFDKNIQLMKDYQAASAKSLRAALKNSDAIWNKNELASKLSKIEKPLTIKSDTTLNRLADNFRTTVLKLAQNADKKPVGILDLRQGVDRLIDREFPASIYTKDTPIGQYVRDVRKSLNDYMQSKLPDGRLPNGSSLKSELRKQSLLYDAIDNVAEKAPRIGESGRPIIQNVKNFAKKHPVATGIAGALGAEKVLKKTGIPLP